MDPVQIRALEERAQAGCVARSSGALPPHAFTTDGCSAWPDGHWQLCCVEHDVAYWCGGGIETRRAADIALRTCVTQRGSPMIADLMYLGVRLGGMPWLPFPWRWGYGWDWPHHYDD
jgi:hypothetical protein